MVELAPTGGAGATDAAIEKRLGSVRSEISTLQVRAAHTLKPPLSSRSLAARGYAFCVQPKRPAADVTDKHLRPMPDGPLSGRWYMTSCGSQKYCCACNVLFHPCRKAVSKKKRR
jgi:hypothetical protein